MEKAPFEVHHDVVDGLPVVWADAPPPLYAAIVFRIGRCDERLTNAGITHLAEHLLLPVDQTLPVHANGVVTITATSGWATGRAEDVFQFLELVGNAASEPPVDRLDVERRTLLAEADWAGAPGYVRRTAALRFGALGAGLIGFKEVGLEGLRSDDVAAWMRAGFAHENAVLAMTGPPPDNLPLALPRGGRRLAAPAPVSLEHLTFPCVYDRGTSGGVAVCFEAPRSRALVAGLGIATERALALLRYRNGIVYDVAWWYEGLDLARAHALMWAECRDFDVDRTRTGLLRVLDDLAAGGPTEEELDRERDRYRRQLSDPHGIGSWLHEEAEWLLLGGEPDSPQKQLAARARMTLEDVRSALAGAMESMLLVIPDDATAPEGRFSRYPVDSLPAVSGTTFRRKRARRDDATLVVGAEGISTVWSDGTAETVRFEECVAVQHWTDGSRWLWSRDGIDVFFDPAYWRDGAELTRLVDPHVPRELIVPMDMSGELDSDPDLRAGDGAYDRSSYRRAATLLRRGLARRPDVVQGWILLSDTERLLDRIERALEAAKRALELDPDRAWAHSVLAKALAADGRDEPALESARRAHELDPLDGSLLVSYAYAAAGVAEADEARISAERAVELFPDDDRGWYALAHALASVGDWQGAEAAYRRALELDPDYSMWNNNVGWALLNLGREGQALPFFDRALELDSENERARWNRELSLRLLGRPEEGLDEVRPLALEQVARAESAIAADPGDSSAHRELADGLSDLGRMAEALSVLRKAVHFEGADVRLLTDAIAAELEVGDPGRASELADRAVSLDPASMLAAYYRAWVAASLGDAAVAEAAAAAASDLDSDDASAWQAQGYVAVAREDWHAAADWLGRSVEREPLHCCSRIWLGLAQVELGRAADAAASFERGTALSRGCRCPARRRLEAAVSRD